MMNKISRIVIFSLLAAMFLGPLGCKKVDKKITTRGLGPQGEKNVVGRPQPPQDSIQTRDGRKIAVAGGVQVPGVPVDFPKDIDIYEHAAVLGTVKSADGLSLNLSTADPALKVAAQYQATMTAFGWDAKSSATLSDVPMLEYQKGTRKVMVHITPNGDTTRIMLMVQ